MLEAFTCRAVLVLLALLAGCHRGVDLEPEALYGLWVTVDEAGGERAWTFAPEDDYFTAAAGVSGVSAICVGGQTVMVASFHVEDGHVVETILDEVRDIDDDGPSTIGVQFGTEILDFEGDTLVMESASAASGERTWRRVPRYDAHAPSGWSVATLPLNGTRDVTAASVAFDADGDWHVEVSESLLAGSLPGQDAEAGIARYASRKGACATRVYAKQGQAGGELLVHDGRLLLPGAWLDTGNQVGLAGVETKEIGNNRAPLTDWAREEVGEPNAKVMARSAAVLPDGRVRFVAVGNVGGYAVWEGAPGGAWSSRPLVPESGDFWYPSRVLYDADGRLIFLAYAYPGAELTLRRELADGSFVSEAIPGTERPGALFTPFDLAIAPDGQLRVAYGGGEGVTLFAREDDGWTPTPLTRTPTEVALAIDAEGVNHLWTRTEGRPTYLRWDGETLLRELPALPPEGAMAVHPDLRVGDEGQVGLVLGGGMVALRPADADAHRRPASLRVEVRGEGEVVVEGLGSCASSCTFEAPAGRFVAFRATPADGYVYQGVYDVDRGARPAVEPTSDGGLFPVEVDGAVLDVVFVRSNVVGLVEPAPATRFHAVGASEAGHALVVATADAAWTAGGVSIPPGRFLGRLDADGAWAWARPLSDGLTVRAVEAGADGGGVLVGAVTGAVDLGLGPLAPSSNLGGDAVIARFDGDTGDPVYVRKLPMVSDALAVASVGEVSYVLAWLGNELLVGGEPVVGRALLRVDGDGELVAAASVWDGVVALDADTDGAIVVGERESAMPHANVAFFAPDLAPGWRGWVGDWPYTAVALDDVGLAHLYGPSRGGEYGPLWLDDPTMVGQPEGAAHVVLAPDGVVASVRGLPFLEVPFGLTAGDDGLRFVTSAQGRPILRRVGATPADDLAVMLVTTGSSGQAQVRGAAWLADRFRVYAQQTGFIDWTLEAGERSGPVVVDARF